MGIYAFLQPEYLCLVLLPALFWPAIESLLAALGIISGAAAPYKWFKRL